MVKLTRLKLVNYIGVFLGTGLTELEIDRTNSNNNIILLVGNNGSGKTSVLSEITPIPLEHLGSRTKSRILDGKVGIKELDYLVDNVILYKIKIIFDPKKPTKCFIRKIVDNSDQELNPNGNVDSYLDVVQNELHMGKNYTNIGYLSKNIKNFVIMKPADRNEYISEWMPEIAEYLDAYRTSSKIITKVKKEIDGYNKEIGNMSSMNYELELNFLNSNIKNLNDQLEEYNKNITELNVYQNQLQPSIKTEKQLADYKLSFLNSVDKLNSFKSEIYKKYELLNDFDNTSLNIDDEIKKYSESKIKIQSDLNKCEENLSLLESEISSNKLMINTDDSLKNIDLTSVYTNIDENNKLIDSISENIDKYINKYGSSDQIYCDENEIQGFRTLIDIIDDKFIQMNNLISLDYIKDITNIEKLITDKKDQNSKIDEIVKSINDKLTQVNNEIYKYEHGNLDTEILMKRPEFCADKTCPVIQELLKYLNPKDNLTDLYEKSKSLQKDLLEETEEKTKIEDSVNDIQKAYEIYAEIEKFLYKNSEKIAKMPILLSTFFSNEPIGIYTHINEIKGIIDDITEYVSLFNKKKELEKSVNELNNIKKIITLNNNIEDKLKQSIERYDSIKIERTDLLTDYDIVSKKLDIYENYTSIIEKRNVDISEYNKQYEDLSIIRKAINIFNKNTYVYNSNNKQLNKMNNEKLDIQTQLIELNKKRDQMTTFYISKKQIEKMRNELQEEFNKVNILNKIWSPKVGYPSWKIESFLNELTIKTNEDLKSMWSSNMKIEEFKIGANEFSIVVNKDGYKIEDASLCSEGETSTLNVGISFAMLESNVTKNGYDIIRLDEIDGPLDETRRANFIPMIQNRLNDLGCDSCFIITHNNEFDDIPCDIMLFKGANLPEEKLKNKNILFRV